jgi:uncharacterized protein YbjT (DUF2867 family)
LRSVGGGRSALAELVEQHVADRRRACRGRRSRAASSGPIGCAGAGLHRVVDLVDRPDALLVGAHRVEHVRHEQAVDDEARLVLGRDRELALRLREAVRRSKASSLVVTARTTSTSFMTWAGLK